MSASIGPVIKGHERIPPENSPRRLLAYIGLQFGGAYFFFTFYLDIIGSKTPLPLRHKFGSAARGKHKQSSVYYQSTSHTNCLLLNSDSVTAVATATFKDSAPLFPNDGMRSPRLISFRTAPLIPFDSLPMTTNACPSRFDA